MIAGSLAEGALEKAGKSGATQGSSPAVATLKVFQVQTLQTSAAELSTYQSQGSKKAANEVMGVEMPAVLVKLMTPTLKALVALSMKKAG